MFVDRQYILTHTPRQIVANAMVGNPFGGEDYLHIAYQMCCYRYGNDLKLPKFNPRIDLDVLPKDSDVEKFYRENYPEDTDITLEAFKVAIIINAAARYVSQISNIRMMEPGDPLDENWC